MCAAVAHHAGRQPMQACSSPTGKLAMSAVPLFCAKGWQRQRSAPCSLLRPRAMTCSKGGANGAYVGLLLVIGGEEDAVAQHVDLAAAHARGVKGKHGVDGKQGQHAHAMEQGRACERTWRRQP